MPYLEYNKEKVENYIQNMRKLLSALRPPRLSIVENHGVDECVTTPVSETGMSLFLSPQTLC